MFSVQCSDGDAGARAEGEKLGTGKESMWVCGCGREREELKAEMLKESMWVWRGKAETLKC